MHIDDINTILKEKGLTETELIFKTKVKSLRENSPGKPTLVETANAIGIKYGTYRLIESYTPHNIKFSLLEQIANYYNIPVSELFKL